MNIDLKVTKSDAVGCDPYGYKVKCFLDVDLMVTCLGVLGCDLMASKADINRC
jgi:hypothetical protein